MPAEWEQHCPISEEDHPVLSQAWGCGWLHRRVHGPGVPKAKTAVKTVGPHFLEGWLQGYSAADRHERDH